MRTFENSHLWSLQEHRFLHFEGEQPKAEQPSPEAKNEKPMQSSAYADRAQERQQRVQDHLQQESLEKDLFDRAQRAVDAVRTKVEQGQTVTAADLRPLSDVMYEVRQKFDGTSAVVQVERILGTVGGGVKMQGPDGTSYRLLADQIDNAKDKAERGGFNFYFMLVKEDRSGAGTPIVRDGPREAESVNAARPLMERAQRAVDAVRTKVEQGQTVTAADLRPLSDVMYEVRQKFDGTSAVVQVEKILGTVGGGVKMQGPDGTSYRLLADQIDNAKDKAERGGFNFYFMLVKEDRSGAGTPIVRDGPREAESVNAARPLMERAQRAVDAVRTKVEQGQTVTAADLRPLSDVMYEVRQKFDGTSAVVQVEKILGTVGGGVKMQGPDGTSYRLLADQIDNAKDKAERGGFNFYFMLVKEDRSGAGTPIVRDGPR